MISLKIGYILRGCKGLLFYLRCLRCSPKAVSGSIAHIFNETKQLEIALECIKSHPSYLPAYVRACELTFGQENYYQAYLLSKKALKIKHVKRLSKIKKLSHELLVLNHGFREAAERFLLDGQYEKGSKAIRKALQVNPEDLSSLLLALEIFKAQKKWDKSKVVAINLRKAHPNQPESYDFLCYEALRKKDLGLACITAKEAIKRFPGQYRFKRYLEKIRDSYAKKRNLESALKIAFAIHQSFPKTEETYWYLCNYLIALDRQSSAQSAADQFLSEFPASFRALKIACQLTYNNKQPEKCLLYANKLIKIHPNESAGHEYKYRILYSQGRVKKALLSLAHGLEFACKKSNLLKLAFSIDLSSKHKEVAVEVVEKLIKIDPFSDKYHNRKLRLLLSCGLKSRAQHHARWLLKRQSVGSNYIFNNNAQGQELYIFAKHIVANKNPLRRHWMYSFQTFKNVDKENLVFTHQPFQYWSQGRPSDQMLELTDQWNHELSKIGMKNILLFDRNSAFTWISENTPELEEPFSSAFYYAVEADIFRIAYAIKNHCVWIDSDMVISESVSATLAQRILSADTTLYIREREPNLSNGFFATRQSSPFFVKIMNEMRNYTFRGKIPSKSLVLDTFGTSRYTKTLAALMEEGKAAEKPCSLQNPCVLVNEWRINFVNKATFGRSKPADGLDYFKTNDNWNRFLSEYEDGGKVN